MPNEPPVYKPSAAIDLRREFSAFRKR